MATLATTTVVDYITKTVTATSTSTSTHRASPQGGILEGANPSTYDPKNPIIMFIIQAGIVIIFCRLLHFPLSKIRQPRVIAEVIGGILLGPSVMGRIPGFTAAIFPTASMPNFSLVANLGLVFFLFLVGLEVDLRFLVSNWKVALSVGLGGMALPFGLGCAISWGLFNEFRHDEGTVPINFGVYMLFIAIAMAITAFPVLCRILSELKLLGTPVGIIVLSAGVGNDVVGWVLLALCVALVNAADGLTALWVLLVSFGYTLFLTLLVRPAFMWYLKKTRSLQDGPSQSVVALTLMIALASAFFTGVIGIHPIFGAFLAGLICPHEGGFAIKVTEKVEDLISTLFLPLYFALSGLNTNLGLLNSGITWAYVVGVTVVAFLAKVIGGSCAARLNGLVWRECFTIGALMSCKGLVELIVLNIGLQAQILSQRTFTIFVVMALVTTFSTTPLTAALYPPWYQKKLEAWKRGEIDWDTGRPYGEEEDAVSDTVAFEKMEASQITRVMMYLRLDSMPGLLALTSLFGGANEVMQGMNKENGATHSGASSSSPPSIKPIGRPIELHGIRLLQLTERDSSVMKVSEADEYSAYDPVVNTFRAFGRLHSVFVSGEVAVVPEVYYADTLTTRASEMSLDLVLLPWSETGSMSEAFTLSSEAVQNRLSAGPYQDFASNVLGGAHCHVAIFVNKGFGAGGAGSASPRNQDDRRAVQPTQLSRSLSLVSQRGRPDRSTLFHITQANRTHRIFLPYFGTADDRVATRFVLQLARDQRLTVLIVHFKIPGSDADTDILDLSLSPSANALANTSVVAGANRKAGKPVPNATAVESLPLHERHAAFLGAMRTSLPHDVASRVTIESVMVEGAESLDADAVTETVVARIAREFGGNTTRDNAGDLVVVGRNGGGDEFGVGSGSGCFGRVGAKVARGVEASLLVVRAAGGR